MTKLRELDRTLNAAEMHLSSLCVKPQATAASNKNSRHKALIQERIFEQFLTAEIPAATDLAF
jgi:hypothetical protein